MLLLWSSIPELADLLGIIPYICSACVCPSENSRALQVSRNGVEEAEKNLNFFGNKSTLEQSEPLIATVILYLSNVTHGGEILFPESEVRISP